VGLWKREPEGTLLGSAQSAPGGLPGRDAHGSRRPFDGDAEEQRRKDRQLARYTLWPWGLAAAATSLAFLLGCRDAGIGVAYATGGVGILISTLAVIVVLGKLQYAFWLRLRRATPAEAEVVIVGRESVARLSSRDVPQVRFVDAEGVEREATPGYPNFVGIVDRKVITGDWVDVRYDPAEPNWVVFEPRRWWTRFPGRNVSFGIPMFAAYAVVFEVTLIVRGVRQLLGV
jgi:hypothetical protein